MRKNGTWAVTAVAALLLLVAATSVFATKTTDPTSLREQTAAPAGDTDQPVTLTLHLTEPLDQGAQPVPLSEVVDQTPRSVAMDVGSAIQRTAQKAKEIALRYLGTPYRWGGTTPKAFDCSGFTRYVYSKLGIKLPRTAREQYRVGMKVMPGNWRTGDLVFFDMRKGYVSHVGMYLANKSFIHAANPRAGVRIDNLATGNYKKCYVGARRYQST